MKIKIRKIGRPPIEIQVEIHHSWKEYIEAEEVKPKHEIDHTTDDRERQRHLEKDSKRRYRFYTWLWTGRNIYRRIRQYIAIQYNNLPSRKDITRTWTIR